jgi:hypothetical protein
VEKQADENFMNPGVIENATAAGMAQAKNGTVWYRVLS